MKRSSYRKKTLKAPASGGVRRLPPSSDAARDEGPRLIPLDDRSKEPSRMEHYLDLADTALGLKPAIKPNI